MLLKNLLNRIGLYTQSQVDDLLNQKDKTIKELKEKNYTYHQRAVACEKQRQHLHISTARLVRKNSKHRKTIDKLKEEKRSLWLKYRMSLGQYEYIAERYFKFIHLLCLPQDMREHLLRAYTRPYIESVGGTHAVRSNQIK